ncbi:TPA: ISLre2 family transposase, partial [Streptococcus suis]
KEMMNYLQATYDLTETIVISNSDGGSGYEKEVFEELSLGCFRHEHFRDMYHVHRKIKERLNFVSSKLQGKLIEAIHQYDKEKVRACLDTAESLIEEREETCLEQLRLLQGYLDRNWVYLQ